MTYFAGNIRVMTDSKEKPKIGDVLKRARLKKGLAPEDVAAMCEISRSRYFQWENSDRILPKNFRRLSTALGISVQTLKRANGRRAKSIAA